MVPGWMNAEQRTKEVNNFLQGMVPNVNVRRGRRANDADLEMHVVGQSMVEGQRVTRSFQSP